MPVDGTFSQSVWADGLIVQSCVSNIRPSPLLFGHDFDVVVLIAKQDLVHGIQNLEPGGQLDDTSSDEDNSLHPNITSTIMIQWAFITILRDPGL